MKIIGIVFLLQCLTINATLGHGTVMSAHVDSDDTLNDALFINDVLFDVRARSRLDCSRLCIVAGNCSSVTYYVNATTTSCRGHITVMTSNSTLVHVRGARTAKRRGAGCPLSGGFTQDALTGLCYKVHRDPQVNFSSAREACLRQDGDLIALDSDAKYSAVLKDPSKLSGYYWIGLRRPGAQTPTSRALPVSDFVWSRTGQPVQGKAHLLPNASLDHSCVTTLFPLNSLAWVAFACDQNWSFICEIA